MKHTPGPWTADVNNNCIWPPDSEDGPPMLAPIATVKNTRDVQLIALAPELLEAVRLFRSLIASSQLDTVIKGNEEEMIEHLDELIAKATK